VPYIKQHERDQIDKPLEDLMIAILKVTDENGRLRIPDAGVFNYVITRLLSAEYGNSLFPSYNSINTAIGILECAKMEFYRRIASPYEDSKKEINGDVYT
jgi:hypothetical protein